GKRRAAAQPAKLLRFDLQLRPIAFVRYQQDRPGDGAQPPTHFLGERHSAAANVHDKQDDIGLIDRVLDLPIYVGGELVAVFNADAAGIDQIEIAIADLNRGGNAVASH